MQTDILMEKIKSLPPERIIEVEDFVDFLSQRSLRNSRQERHDSIAAYALQFTATKVDLEPTLEPEAVEHLLTELKEEP